MKVVFEKAGSQKRGQTKGGWREIRYKHPETGKMTVRRVLDMESPTFDDDLTMVFSKNIARAVRENRKLSKAG